MNEIASVRPILKEDLANVISWRSGVSHKFGLSFGERIGNSSNDSVVPALDLVMPRSFLVHEQHDCGLAVLFFSTLDSKHEAGEVELFFKPHLKMADQCLAVMKMIQFAREYLELEKLTTKVVSHDHKAIMRLQRAGFEQEGVMVNQLSVGPDRYDAILLGLQIMESSEEEVSEYFSIYLDSSKLSPNQASRITILSDVDSWINTFLYDFVIRLELRGHRVKWMHDLDDCSPGDICICISCSFMVPESVRRLFKNTVVVHESALPKGKGWSPMTWQVIMGQSIIPITLFEATEDVDSGKIYSQDFMTLQGSELVDELRKEQAGISFRLLESFIEDYPRSAQENRGQTGTASYFRRRNPSDSRLDPDNSLRAQFNLLRTVDNDRYPAFFDINGKRYILKIKSGEKLDC